VLAFILSSARVFLCGKRVFVIASSLGKRRAKKIVGTAAIFISYLQVQVTQAGNSESESVALAGLKVPADSKIGQSASGDVWKLAGKRLINCLIFA
jgi:hypothetical protein